MISLRVMSDICKLSESYLIYSVLILLSCQDLTDEFFSLFLLSGYFSWSYSLKRVNL